MLHKKSKSIKYTKETRSDSRNFEEEYHKNMPVILNMLIREKIRIYGKYKHQCSNMGKHSNDLDSGKRLTSNSDKHQEIRAERDKTYRNLSPFDDHITL